MFILVKGLLFGAAIISGAMAGAVAAFFATGYSCVFVDWLRDARGGNGIVTVGWLFCFFTVPMGFYYGGCLGFHSAAFLAEASRNRLRPQTQTRSNWIAFSDAGPVDGSPRILENHAMNNAPYEIVADDLSDTSQVPRAHDLFYECGKCGDFISSQPNDSTGCGCGNVFIDTDSIRLLVEDFSAFRVVRKTGQ